MKLNMALVNFYTCCHHIDVIGTNEMHSLLQKRTLTLTLVTEVILPWCEQVQKSTCAAKHCLMLVCFADTMTSKYRLFHDVLKCWCTVIAVLLDMTGVMFNKRFMDEVFKPQEVYPKKSLRAILERFAHASVMRLNPTSMEKVLIIIVIVNLGYGTSLRERERTLFATQMNSRNIQ